MPQRRRNWYDAFWEFDQMDDLMRYFTNEALDQLREKDGPIFYGFSISVGSDGKPAIQEFGNVKPGLEGPQVKDVIDPLVDVVERGNTITVYAELPGVDKKDIDLSLSDNSLTITVQGEKRRYYKEVPLPSKVKLENAKASYNNGILEAVLHRDIRQAQGKHLKVDWI